ncbi:hypothetical protein ACOMHN_061326 [Nucella lapillus]
MSMMRARVQGHRWVDHPAAAVMKARVPGQWVDRPAAVVMEAREQGRCWIDNSAVAVMEARPPISGIMDNKHILSALHVAGLDHVYVHGDVEPWGPWWNELRTQNVTFVRLDPPATVFEQTIEVPAHISDVVRYSLLYKYGGIYQDTDVIWVNKLPDWLLGYPAVAGPEWPRYGEWPEALNLGVLLARRHAPFLRHFLSTYRYFRDADKNFNAVLMPYRTYEWYPDTLFVDQFLQAVCVHGICHPSWSDNNDDDNPDDDRPIMADNDNNDQQAPAFNVQEVRAIHLRVPKVPESLSSPGAVKAGTDMFADIGRYVLRQADRQDLFGEDADGRSY